MAQRGLMVSTVVLDVSEVEPPAAIRERLGMGRGHKALSVRRLRGTSKVFPIVLLHSYVPSHFGISRSEDFTGSLYQLIENKYHIPIAYADEEISACGARKEEAKHLQIAAGSTVMVMERRTFTSMDRPLEYVRAVYRPEHYTFTIRLRR